MILLMEYPVTVMKTTLIFIFRLKVLMILQEHKIICVQTTHLIIKINKQQYFRKKNHLHTSINEKQ